ncbi:MoaD/ThiS family protein [Caldicellulosiruptor naganoensis]|uniref:MoaD/ThiS family protein n=1 Tax=Caldicellulosiruptor naganoensis TaxID=29324 RepID=A0ABY7BGP2_9FIRM|nr:MoaD/ThiS family protein [Caldicellulosiruptor naganoensis]WAM31754.1 MoaD/ThiS family protein [Caldicellulosiruptor naganoensis]
MTVIFVGSNKQVTVKGPKSAEKVAKELGVSLESHVFIKDGEIVAPDEILQDEDTVEVISAISGG